MDTHDDLINELKQRRETIKQGGGEKYIDKQHERGKLTARERIKLFFDPGSFQELDGYWVDHDGTEKIGEFDNHIMGFGKVFGRMVCCYAQDFTLQGGSFSEVHGKKLARLISLAMDSGVPVVGLMDSVGARIQSGVLSMAAYGELFWHGAQASGVIPQISVILGPCAGGSVYSPGMTDFVIMTKGTSQMFITGPQVIETVTREKIDKESLGGAMMHNTSSGVAHFAAEDEEDAINITRKLISYLPLNNAEPAPRIQPEDDPWRRDPELNSLVPMDSREPYDIRDAINHIFDVGSFLEVHALFAPNAVVGFARLHGEPVGVVGNQPMHLAGTLDINSADKIARFVRFCDAFNLSIITFVDSPGFLPGVSQEQLGIIRHGAKIVFAYSEATVPKLAVITGKAYGGAYVVMSSKQIRTDVVLAWPTAEVAVMGASGAVSILKRKELAVLKPEEKQDAIDQWVAEYKEKYNKPYHAASHGAVDEIVIPSETRPKLIAMLELLKDKRFATPTKKHSNMPL